MSQCKVKKFSTKQAFQSLVTSSIQEVLTFWGAYFGLFARSA